jgi:PAS domain S-box-containing protein
MSNSTFTVLIVEDFANSQERYQDCLLTDPSCAYELLEAASVAEGLALCQTQAIDAVLLDYLLPDGNGLDFLERLLVQSNGSSPPVVMIADYSNERIAIRAIKLGAEDYLVKSELTPDLLLSTMHSAIENTRLRLQLRESEERFQAAVDHTIDCLGIYSAIRDAAGRLVDFRFDYLNAAAMRSNRMTAADMSRTLCEVFPTTCETGLLDEYEQVLNTGIPLIKENLVYADVFGGEQRTSAYHMQVGKLDDGIVISWREITAQKQAELRLQAANQQMTIWESMTDAYGALDRDWRIVYANPMATQIFRQLSGQSSDFVGKNHWEVFPATVGTIVEQEYRRAVAEQVAVHFEIFYPPTETWFEIHAYPSDEGLGIYFRDIDERKQNELVRTAAEQERDRFFNLSLDLLIVANLDGYFVRINPACEKILGFTSAEMMAQPYLDLVHPDDRAATTAAVEELTVGNVLISFENRYRGKDGSYRWLLWSSKLDQERNVIYANAHDITDRKQAELNERFLYELTQRLQQLTDAEAIQWEAVKSLGEYLHADRATWFEVNLERGLATVERDWYRAGLASHAGVYKIADFILPELQAALNAGNSVAISDVTTHRFTATHAANFEQLGIGAFVNIPCIEAGRWVATLSLNTTTARNWGEFEIGLMQAVVSQLWSSIAQAKTLQALKAQKRQTRAAQAIVEQQLREIESIYRMAPVGLCFVDTDFCYVRINEQLAEINGLSVAEHIGQNLREILPEMADRVEPLYTQIMASGEPIIDLELTGSNRAQPGIERCWLASFYPQTDNGGRVVGVNTVVQEITARKQEEAQLKQAELMVQQQLAEIESIYRAAPIGLSYINSKLKFVRINEQLAQINGLPVAEHIGLTIRDVLPEMADRIERLYRQVIESGEPIFDLEMSGITPSQPGVERHWLASYYPQTDVSGRVIGVNAIVQEITDRKIAAQRLQESEQRLRTGVEVAGVGLAKCDYATGLVELSPEAAALYGFAADISKIPRGQLYATFHPDERAELKAVLDRVRDPLGEGWFAQDHRVVWPSGEVRWLSVRKQVFFEGLGAAARPSYAILAAVDITDRKQNQAALEERNRELDSFVHIVAHDLKAPLRAVSNLSQWIEDDLEGQLTAENQLQMTQLRNRVRRMAATIDGLIEYARVGRSEDQIEPVALARLLADVIESVAPPPTFTLSLPAQLPTLSTKRLPLFQVFTNLIGNAIKHHNSETGSIQVSIADRGAWYEFAIADDGPGIAAEHQERMFRIFQAMNPQNRSDSTGIGLAIVKKIIEAEGGTIWLESELGKGTTFYFTWPKSSDDPRMSNPEMLRAM